MTVKDSSAHLAVLSGQQIASLDIKNVDFLESSDENGALALTAAQFSALVTSTRLAVKPATVATLSDTAAAISAALAGLADLTPEQWQRLSSKGIDGIDATDGGHIEMSVETYRSLSWSFAANDTLVPKDTPDAFDQLVGSDLEALAGRGIDIIDSTTGTFTITLDKFNLLGTVGFAAGDHVAVNWAPADAVTGLSAQAIAAMDARGVDTLDTAGTNVLALSAAQVAAIAESASFGIAQDETVTLTDAGVAIATAFAALTGAQIGTLAAKGIDAINATGTGAFSLSLEQLGALGGVALSADDAITLVDTGTAFAGLSAVQIAALTGKGMDAFDAVDNRVALSLAQFKALGTLRLAASDTFDIRGTASGDSVLGKANKEMMLGLAGNDRLNGGSGNDTLSGGAGKDTLTGGSGYDRFRFDAALSARTNLDTVTDWRNGYDKFLLDDVVFKKMGTGTAAGRALNAKFFAFGARKDKDDYLSYDPKTGKVSYDPDGIGAKAKAVDFLQLQKGLSAKILNAGDFLIV